MAAPNVSFYVHRDFQAVPKILEMLIVLIAYIHIISCMWFALGTFPASNQNTWARAINLDQEPIAHKYTMSFHFIWTCLINASHDVLLLNTFERVCTLFVWISWDSAFFSLLLSTMTQNIVQFQEFRRARVRQIISTSCVRARGGEISVADLPDSG